MPNARAVIASLVVTTQKSTGTLVKVVSLDPQETALPRRLGFLAGEIAVPDDFDRMGQDEVERQFGVDG
jgi:hypothetical protein